MKANYDRVSIYLARPQNSISISTTIFSSCGNEEKLKRFYTKRKKRNCNILSVRNGSAFLRAKRDPRANVFSTKRTKVARSRYAGPIGKSAILPRIAENCCVAARLSATTLGSIGADVGACVSSLSAAGTQIPGKPVRGKIEADRESERRRARRGIRRERARAKIRDDDQARRCRFRVLASRYRVPDPDVLLSRNKPALSRQVLRDIDYSLLG